MKIKRFLIFVLAVVLAGMCPVSVYAEEGDTQQQTDAADGQAKTEEEIAAQEAEQEKQEKEASYARAIDTNGLDKWPEGPAVYADSAVVMDMESGAILFSKNMDAQHYPASITKLMTTLVALENGKLTDKVKFTEDSISFLEYGDASIGMKAGEELNLKDSLYAVLLASANEVSHAVAESVGATALGGDYDTFIQKMNERATELGCTNSHWVNPNGLHDDNHYTSAHDMALIASAVYQQEEFRKIMGTLEYKIGFTNLTKEERVFQQNHKMMWPENYYYYEYCTGGKTGYTDQAKTTLVTMADNGSMHLAAVVMYDYGVDAYTDTRSMMDYVFGNFSKVPIPETEITEDIQAIKDTDAYVVLPEGIEFSQLDKETQLSDEGIRDGKLLYSYEGQHVGGADITLTELGYEKLTNTVNTDANQEKPDKKETSAKKTEDNNTLSGKQSLIIGVAAGVLLFLLVIAGVLIGRKRSSGKHRRSGRNSHRKRR